MRFKQKDAKKVYDQFIKLKGISKNNLKLNLYFTGNNVYLDDLLLSKVPHKRSIRLVDHHWLNWCDNADTLFKLIGSSVEFVRENMVLKYA